MNRRLQRILALALLVLAGTYARSQTIGNNYDAYVGGVYYKLNKEAKTASVTFIRQLVQRPMNPQMPVEIIYETDYKGSIVIPKTIEVDDPITVAVDKEEYTVTSIGHHAFYRCTGLRSVVLPATVTSISSSAFEGCTMLSSIDMPLTMEIIADRAFYGCRNAKLIFPKVLTLGTDALTGSKIGVGVEAYGLCFVPDKEEGTAMLIAKDIDVDENGSIIYNKDAKYEGKIALGGSYSINGNTESYRLNSISDHAFTNCSIDGLYLRSSITTVSPAAFEDAQINSVFVSEISMFQVSVTSILPSVLICASNDSSFNSKLAFAFTLHNSKNKITTIKINMIFLFFILSPFT